MRWSETFIPTLRESPAGIKHRGLQLLIRGGYLRLIDNERCVQLPLLTRVADKLRRRLAAVVEAVGGCPINIADREEEAVAPSTAPKAVAGQTEAIVNSLVRREIRSYRQFPFALFHFSALPGEQRPCVSSSPVPGCSEWIGVHAFTSARDSLQAYVRLLEQSISSELSSCGLTVVEATVLSGGEELIAVSDSPHADRQFFSCHSCNYKATAEAAHARPIETPTEDVCASYTRVATPGARTVDQVTAFLGVPAQKLVKTLLFKTDQGVIGVLIRGDRTLNESKLRHVMEVSQLDLLDAEGVQKLTGAQAGFSGPIGIRNIQLIADMEVISMKNFVVGANVDDEHFINVNLADFPIAQTADLCDAVDGDSCPHCDSGILRRGSGFAIGCTSSVSDLLAAGVLIDDENGNQVAVCRGVVYVDMAGILSAVAEMHHDDRGVCWPPALAPYDVHLIAVNPEDDRQGAAVRLLEDRFAERGLDVLYDDRPIRMGVRFYDADLVGLPYRVVIGPKKLAEGLVELGLRATGGVEDVEIDNVVQEVARLEKKTKNG